MATAKETPKSLRRGDYDRKRRLSLLERNAAWPPGAFEDQKKESRDAEGLMP